MIRFLKTLSQQIIRSWKQRVSPKVSGLLSAVEAGGLILSGLAIWGFAEVADEVLDKETQAFDTGILLSIRQLESLGMTQAIVAITRLGEPSLLAVLSALVGLFFLLRRRWAELITLAIAAAGAIGLNSVLKIAFERARPDLWNQVIDVRYYSFPSGHAMISLVIYGILGYFLAKQFPKYQGLIFTITTVLVIAIGFSRLYLGVHWPTDVIAGYAAGFVWLFACVLSLEIFQRTRSRSEPTLSQFRSSSR